MNYQKDLCPNNENGIHRYFIFKVAEVFEPYQFNVDMEADPLTIATLNALPYLYEKVEYAISGCNCGSSVKQRVIQQ